MATFSFEDAQDTGSFSFEDAQTPETFSFAEGLDTPTRTFGGTVKDVGVSAYKGMLGLQNSLVGLADIVVPGNLGGWVSSGVEAVTGLTPKEADKQMSAKYSPAQQLANQAVADAEGFLGKAGAMVQHPSTIGHRLTISAPPMAAGGVLGRGLMWAAGNVPGLLASAAGEGLIAAGSAQEQIRQESPTDDTTPLQTGAAILSGMGTGAVNLASGGLASKVGLGDIDTMLTTGVRDVVGKGGPRAIAGRVAGGAVTEGAEETLQSGQEQIWQNAALGKPLMEGVPEVAGEGLVTGAAMGMGANVAVRPSHLPNENILSAESIDQVVAEFEADSISAEPEVTAQPTGALARAPELYRGMYREAGLRYGVDPNLLAAQGWAESNFNPDAVSPAGAQGIAQFMPGTAAEYGIDPMNPVEAIDGQARYMAKMLERYGGDVSKALAAYNAGPGRVDDGSWQNINETQNYVGRILGELGQESGPMPAEWAAQTEAAQVYNQQRNQPQLDESIQFAPLEEEARPAEAPAVGSVALSIEEGAPLYTAQVSGDQLAVNDPQSDLSSADAPQQAVRNAGGVAFKSREDAELRRELAIDHIATIRAKGQLPRQQLHDIVAAADEYLATGSVSGGVAGEQVFGHPQATNILPAKYGNLIPIKAKDRSAVERRIDAAQALFDEVAQDIGQTRFDASKGDKQAKLALKSAGFREKETVMELLRDETMPSLNRLLKQFPEDAKTRKDADVADAAGFVRESVVYPGQTTPNALPTSNANALPARNNDVNTDIETELSSQLGSGRAKRLVSSGKVQILETQQDAEAAISNLDATPKRSEDGKVQGFTTPDGKVHLVRDGIAKGNAMGVLAHEMGVHAKRLGFKKDAEWQGIVDSIERRKTSNGRSGQAIRAAMDRIPKDTAPEHVQEELVGYLVENHAGDKIPIVDRIVAQIKKWLYQAGIMHADRLTPKELAIFARAAIREEARRSGKLAEGGRVADVALSRQQQAEASESRAAKTNGLPMDFDSRMARAREMGFDTDTVFSHASWTDPVIERILAKDTTFDGLFAVEGEESSHGGPHQHRFIVKTHFDHADLSRSFRNDDAPFKEVVKRELGEEPGTNEDWSLLEDLVLENESVHELWSDEDSVPTFFKEALGGYISGDLLADISWNIQKLRGKVAKEYGADAIDMTDEHGTSVLLLPGSGVRSLKAAFDPSYVESDRLLRSMAEPLGVTPEQPQREYDAVVKRYQGTVRWLKAPNGKQSNLNERQWVQVRTESFKKWFGDWENDSDNASKVIDDNEEPLVVYHGSPSPEFSEFNLDKSGSNLDPGWLGKGIYFTDTAATADYHSQTGRASRPGVYPVFLNIKNPFEWGKKTKGIRGLVMNGEQLPLDLTEKISEKTGFKFDRDAEPDWDAEKKLSRELTDELSSRGFDGVVASVGGQKEFVAFSPTQIKSATGNTGAFDGGNPDIRYSKASPEATIRDEAAKAVEAAPATQDVKHSRVSPQELEQQQENLDQDLQDVAEQVPKKFDIRAATPWVKTAEYTLSKIAAGRRALEAVSRRQERRFMLQAQILDGETPGMTAAERQVARDNGFIATFKQLKKDAPQSYTNVQRYLLEIDRTGRGFHLSHESGYVVTTPDGKLVGLAKTREEALTKARDHVRDNGLKGKVLIKDYGTDKGFIWTAHKPNKGKIGTFTNEQEAVAAMIKGEQAELRQRGFTEQEAAAVQSFREMTNRAFDQHAEGAREVLRRCEEEGIDPPMVEGIDETRRWAVRGKGGKNIATFESREKAQDMLRQLMGTHPKFANAQIVRQADGEIKKMYSLHDAIAQMGDMRGTYFPRQREHGGMGLRAINEQTGEKIFLKGDLYLANLDPEAKQGVLAQKADALRKLFNSGTPLGLEARKLRRQGFVISFERDTTMPEDVFSAKQLSTNIAALMDEGMQRVDKSSMTPAEVAAYISMHRAVTDQLAGIIKQRGFLSSRMKRSENYWQGFEEDPLKAGTAYANGLAGGVAKRQLAQDLTMIIAGRDITWKQWKEENPKGDWPEYTEFVNNRKIDPVKQKNIYGETMSWAEEVLRNQEAADRIIDTLRGLAVLKYLAFRIPSALANLSNLAMAVPATISSHTGLSLTRSAAQINSSLKTLADYKRGKASAEDAMVLAEISERGWDNPQFNHDAVAVLRGRWGNAWQDFVDAGMWLFGQAEVINRRATIHAAYKMWQRANPELTHEELMQKAHHASDRAHGWYGRATEPKWTRGAANPLKLAWTFQKFGQNYLLNIDEMLGKGDHKQAAYMLLAPVILGGPKATMITPLLVALAKGLGVGGEDPEEELYAWARDTFGTDAWMRFGVPGLLGISFQGSLAMGIPVVSDVLEKGKRLNSLAELLGAPGSVVYDAYSAGKHALKGEYLKAAEKALPSAFGSVAKAIRESTEGVTTESYGSVYYGADPLKVSGVEAYLRGLSFSTADIAGKRQQQWRERKVKDKYSERRADINREIKRLYLQYDYNPPDMEWAGILVKIDKYNDKVIGLNRPDITPITAKSIRAMLKRNARASKFERMRAMEMYEEAGE